MIIQYPKKEVPKHRLKKKDDLQVDYVWENQRGTALLGVPRFSAKSLLPTDRGAWSDEAGKFSLPKESIQLPDPEKWKWTSTWMIDMTLECDPEGWQYAFNFGHFRWSPVPSISTYVRRRRWKRVRQQIATTAGALVTSISSSSSSSSSAALSSIITSSSTSPRSTLQILPRPSTPLTPPLIMAYRNKIMRLDRERLEHLSFELEQEKKSVAELLGSEPDVTLVEVLNFFDFDVSKMFVVQMLMKSFPKEVEWIFKVANEHLLFYADRLRILTLRNSLLPSSSASTSSLAGNPM